MYDFPARGGNETDNDLILISDVDEIPKLSSVNLNKIKEFLKTERYLIMESNHKIPVARQRKSEFLDKF